MYAVCLLRIMPEIKEHDGTESDLKNNIKITKFYGGILIIQIR